jgi:hypothetical protein
MSDYYAAYQQQRASRQVAHQQRETTDLIESLSRRLDQLTRKFEARKYRIAVRDESGRITHSIESPYPPRRKVQRTMTDTNGTTNDQPDTLDYLIEKAMAGASGETSGDDLTQLVLGVWKRVQGIEADIDAIEGRLNWLEARVR